MQESLPAASSIPSCLLDLVACIAGTAGDAQAAPQRENVPAPSADEHANVPEASTSIHTPVSPVLHHEGADQQPPCMVAATPHAYALNDVYACGEAGNDGSDVAGTEQGTGGCVDGSNTGCCASLQHPSLCAVLLCDIQCCVDTPLGELFAQCHIQYLAPTNQSKCCLETRDLPGLVFGRLSSLPPPPSLEPVRPTLGPPCPRHLLSLLLFCRTFVLCDAFRSSSRHYWLCTVQSSWHWRARI